MAVTTSQLIVANRLVVCSATPTVSTTPAYSVGDNVGGKMVLSPDPARLPGGTFWIVGLVLTSRWNNEAPEMDVTFWNDDPASSTLTDNAVQFVTDADLPKTAGWVKVMASDWQNLGYNKFLGSPLFRPIPVVMGPGRTTLYLTLITRTVITYASTSDLGVRVYVVQH